MPCGIEGKGVTSLSAELQRDVSVEETVPQLLDAFREQFSCELTEGRVLQADGGGEDSSLQVNGEAAVESTC